MFLQKALFYEVIYSFLSCSFRKNKRIIVSQRFICITTSGLKHKYSPKLCGKIMIVHQSPPIDLTAQKCRLSKISEHKLSRLLLLNYFEAGGRVKIVFPRVIYKSVKAVFNCYYFIYLPHGQRSR